MGFNNYFVIMEDRVVSFLSWCKSYGHGISPEDIFEYVLEERIFGMSEITHAELNRLRQELLDILLMDFCVG